MKILLLGEYSNVHYTLSQGLRALGHDAIVISDGDGFKGYLRHFDLSRRSASKLDAIRYTFKLLRLLDKMRGYDIVQIINPMFVELKAAKIFPLYRYLRKHNKHIVMGAFGMDHYWVSTCLDCKTFRYSDFNIGDKSRADEPHNKPLIADWMGSDKERLNKMIASDADLIVSGLYEYDLCYRPVFPSKTSFIPFPIDMSSISDCAKYRVGEKIRFFIGIQRSRSVYKGTDIMLRALERLEKAYGDRIVVTKAYNVPYYEYEKMLNGSHILLDQLYSYTPAMNALMAMAKGMIVVGGGEEEQYEAIGEHELRPIVNVLPNEDDVYDKLEALVLHPENIAMLQSQSKQYIAKHHDHIKIATQYIKAYEYLSNLHKAIHSEC